MVPPAFDSWSHSPSTTPAPPSKDQRQHHPSSSSQDPDDKPKKPRHRHAAWQLVALNELYERDEHPPLDERTSLAEHLGMEVKTVNAWFQNKRASTKKRSNKGTASTTNGNSASHANHTSNNNTSNNSHASTPAQCELPPISALIASVSAPSSQHEYEDSEEEHLAHLPFMDQAQPQGRQQQSAFYAGNPNHRHLFESESNMVRKGRSRPTAAQTEELRKLYEVNPHPSKEEREELGVRIGMRYQSVTNWFQNQRSIAKKRKEEEEAKGNVLEHTSASARAISHAEHLSSSRGHSYSPFPPSSSVAHPSLSVPPATGHPSLGVSFVNKVRRSPSMVPMFDSRASSPRPSPYGTAMTERSSSANGRSRRSRPEPYQLEALKKLFQRTATPSIEERGALALEINMDVGKVTNWFRNLRQTSRRRSKRGTEGSDYDDDDMSVSAYNDLSRNVSREGSPASMSSDERDGHVMDQDYHRRSDMHNRVKMETEEKVHPIYTHASNSRSSDMASEEDFQEAVTPSPASSPYPAFPNIASRHPHVDKAAHAPQPRRDISYAVGALSYAEMEKASAQLNTGVKVEDALLLLSFHHNVVR